MKNINLLTLFIIILQFQTPAGNAQDIIYRTNGARIESRVVEQGANQISYFRIDDPNKTVYELSNFYIDSIKIENGESIIFSEASAETSVIYPMFNRNILQVNLYDLLGYGSFNLTYEYLTGLGNLGLSAGFGINFSPESIPFEYTYDGDVSLLQYANMISREAPFYIRFSTDYYPWQKGIFRIGVGPSLVFGKYKGHEYGAPSGSYEYRALHNLMFGGKVRIYMLESLILYTSYELTLLSFNGDFISFSSLGLSYSF